MYIVKLEEKCWLAPWDGDPGRTVVEKNAENFGSEESAKHALKEAQKFRPFKFAEVHEVKQNQQVK